MNLTNTNNKAGLARWELTSSAALRHLSLATSCVDPCISGTADNSFSCSIVVNFKRYLLSRLWESISIGLPPSERIAFTSFSLLALPVTNTGARLFEAYNVFENALTKALGHVGCSTKQLGQTVSRSESYFYASVGRSGRTFLLDLTSKKPNWCFVSLFDSALLASAEELVFWFMGWERERMSIV